MFKINRASSPIGREHAIFSLLVRSCHATGYGSITIHDKACSFLVDFENKDAIIVDLQLMLGFGKENDVPLRFIPCIFLKIVESNKSDLFR